MEQGVIIWILILNSILLFVIILLLIAILKRFDVSEYWEKMLDVKIRNIIYGIEKNDT